MTQAQQVMTHADELMASDAGTNFTQPCHTNSSSTSSASVSCSLPRCHRGHCTPIAQTRRNTKKHPGFRIFADDLPSAVFMGPGSAARIVRAGILWWLAVLGGDNCHSGGPVQHPGFVARRSRHCLADRSAVVWSTHV